MTVNIDIPNTTISLIFSAQEWTTVTTIQQQSPGAFRNLVQNWLQERSSAIQADLRRSILDKLASATDAQLLEAKKVLGL
jgi:hypothetical protein